MVTIHLLSGIILQVRTTPQTMITVDGSEVPKKTPEMVLKPRKSWYINLPTSWRFTTPPNSVPVWPGFLLGTLPNEKERQRVNGRLHGWSVRSSQEVQVEVP